MLFWSLKFFIIIIIIIIIIIVVVVVKLSKICNAFHIPPEGNFL